MAFAALRTFDVCSGETESLMPTSPLRADVRTTTNESMSFQRRVTRRPSPVNVNPPVVSVRVERNTSWMAATAAQSPKKDEYDNPADASARSREEDEDP